MTHALTGIYIYMRDSGEIDVSAPDYDNGGHTYVVQNLKIDLSQLKQIGKILGGDFPDSIQARLNRIEHRLEQEVVMAESAYERIVKTKARLDKFKRDRYIGGEFGKV